MMVTIGSWVSDTHEVHLAHCDTELIIETSDILDAAYWASQDGWKDKCRNLCVFHLSPNSIFASD